MFDSARGVTLFLKGDHAGAAELFRRGAEEGDAESAFRYAECLLHGYGAERDPKEAKSFFAFARDLPGGDSLYNLAILSLHGEGVSKNFRKAFSYMSAAGAAGCIEAQLYLGMAYTVGALLEPDIVGISRIPFHTPIYRADTPMLAGEVPEEVLLKEEEERYSVLEADGHHAFLWFRAAAYHDATYVSDLVAKGKFLYAKCYADGLGTDFQREKAVRLMIAAGKSGSADAVAYLGEHGISPDRYLTGK